MNMTPEMFNPSLQYGIGITAVVIVFSFLASLILVVKWFLKALKEKDGTLADSINKLNDTVMYIVGNCKKGKD